MEQGGDDHGHISHSEHVTSGGHGDVQLQRLPGVEGGEEGARHAGHHGAETRGDETCYPGDQ